MQALGIRHDGPPGLMPSLTVIMREPLASMPQRVTTRMVTAIFPDCGSRAGLIGRDRTSTVAAMLSAGRPGNNVPLARVLTYALLTCQATQETKLRFGFWILDRHHAVRAVPVEMSSNNMRPLNYWDRSI